MSKRIAITKVLTSGARPRSYVVRSRKLHFIIKYIFQWYMHFLKDDVKLYNKVKNEKSMYKEITITIVYNYNSITIILYRTTTKGLPQRKEKYLVVCY